MRMNKHVSVVLLVVLGLIVLLSFFFLPLINYLICIVLGGLCILPFVKNRFILALFFSILSSIIVVTILAFIAEAIFHTSSLFLFFNGLSILIIIFLSYRLSKQKKKIILRLNRAELIGLFCACVSVVILLIPALSLNTSSSFIRFLSNGEDNASHFAMYHRVLKTGSLPNFDTEPTGLIDGLVIYPQGLHYYMAYVTSALSSNHLPGLLLELRLYYMFATLLMGGVVAFAVILITDRLKKPWDILGGIGCLLALMLSLGFFLMGWGFVTQIASYLFLLAGLYALQNFVNNRSPFFFIMYLVSVIGVSSTWYLVLPVIGLPALVYFKTIWQYLMEHKKRFFIVLVAAVTSLAPILVNILFSTKNSPLNEPGGVYVLGWIAWLIIGLGFCASLLMVFFKKWLQLNNFSGVAIAWLGALIISIYIGTYQLATVGVFAYYFHKSVYTLLLLSIILVVWVLMQTCVKIVGNSSKKIVILFLCGCIVFLTASIIVLKPIYPIVYINNWFNHFLLPDTLHQPTELYIAGYSEPQDVVYMGACVVPLDYLANRWTGALFLQESIPRSKFEGRIITDQPEQIQASYLTNYLTSVNPKDVTIITGHCLTESEADLLKSIR